METTVQTRVGHPTFETVWAAMQENATQMKELKESQKETDRIVKRVSRQMGDLHNKFGKLAEHLVLPGIVKRFNELGFYFKAMATKGMTISEGNKIKAEIDAVLENEEYIIAVEIKTQPKVKDIEHHIKRLEILREYKDEWNDHRKILGAIAGAIFENEAKQATLGAGMYVIEQSGDTMKIDVPDSFVPKEW